MTAGTEKRGTPSGHLFPDLLLDDQAQELWGGNERVDRLRDKDADCDVLLVLGVRLQSKAVARMLKALAHNVHQKGGVVVYVDWKTLDPVVWSRYFDLHLEIGPDLWAEYCMDNPLTVSNYVSSLFVNGR